MIKKNLIKIAKIITALIAIIILLAMSILMYIQHPSDSRRSAWVEKTELPNHDIIEISLVKDIYPTSISVSRINIENKSRNNLDFFEGYDCLGKATFEGDSLILVLKDTSYRSEIISTFYVYPDLPAKYMPFPRKFKQDLPVNQQTEFIFEYTRSPRHTNRGVFSVTKINRESYKRQILKWFNKYNYLENYSLKEDSLIMVLQKINYRRIVVLTDTIALQIDNFEENKDLADSFW